MKQVVILVELYRYIWAAICCMFHTYVCLARYEVFSMVLSLGTLVSGLDDVP
jgi:hypothetical protein